MACANPLGLKTLLITFQVCVGPQAGRRVGPISHSEFGDSIPMIRNVNHKNTSLPGRRARVKQSPTPKHFELEVMREPNVPLAWYQGDASMDIDAEMLDGSIYTVIGGMPTGEEKSDTNSIKLSLDCDEIGEFLPVTPI